MGARADAADRGHCMLAHQVFACSVCVDLVWELALLGRRLLTLLVVEVASRPPLWYSKHAAGVLSMLLFNGRHALSWHIGSHVTY